MLPLPAPDLVDLALYGVSRRRPDRPLRHPPRREQSCPGCRPGSGQAHLGPRYRSLTRYTKTAKLE